MILSDRTIREHLASGRLKVDPLADDTIRENGLDLRITELQVVNETFALASTLEFVAFPDDLVGFANLRSTWARRGFSVPPTVIDAGFEGDVTVELVRHDPTEEWPETGERFLHLILSAMTTPSEHPYRGKYQGQRGVTPARPD